ncbi:hypothetical protein NEFER03_1549 [Nematocida sp. LUAm3]|nr:hypothetical protein NEFER03_1549 [Nematocida sp. LUAm3]KAI5174582.1 hypothetical protein NEFER02_0703 [Nematocida sp. LUAm2]KAI5178012.1 hypothetical protein NEFER01_1194 [Nematocida sp. LUAm1]
MEHSVKYMRTSDKEEQPAPNTDAIQSIEASSSAYEQDPPSNVYFENRSLIITDDESQIYGSSFIQDTDEDEFSSPMSFLRTFYLDLRKTHRINILSFSAMIVLTAMSLYQFLQIIIAHNDIKAFIIIEDWPKVDEDLLDAIKNMFIPLVAAIILYQIYIYLDLSQGNNNKPMKYKMKKMAAIIGVSICLSIATTLLITFLYLWLREIVHIDIFLFYIDSLIELCVIGVCIIIIIIAFIQDCRRKSFMKNKLKLLIVILCSILLVVSFANSVRILSMALPDFIEHAKKEYFSNG